MEKDKDNVIVDFNNMILESWTYAKMNREEKENWNKVLTDIRTEKCLRGSYYARWDILQAIYHAYLIGLGYNSFNWREVE